MATAEELQGWHPGHSPWAVALTVTIATFMEVMDTSIANVALPHIAGGLSAGQDESTWVLTSYLVQDPPHMQKARREAERSPVDFMGLVLVGTGLGALQVVLDKGQRDDWFNSPFITSFAMASVCALVALVFWEWNQKHPII